MKTKALLILAAGVVLLIVGFTVTTVIGVGFHHEINDNEGITTTIDGDAVLLNRFGMDIAAPSISGSFLMEQGIEVSSMNVSFLWSVTGLDVDWTSLVIHIERQVFVYYGLNEYSEKIGSTISTDQTATFQEVVELGRRVPLLIGASEIGHGDLIRVEYHVAMNISANNVFGVPMTAEGVFGVYFEVAWDAVNLDITVSPSSETGVGSEGFAGIEWTPTSVFGGNTIAVPIIFIALGCFAMFFILNKKKMLLG